MPKAAKQEIVGVRINKQQYDSCMKMLSGIKNGAVSMMSMSLNKTVTGVKTDVKKSIAKEIKLSQARIAKDISLKKATRLDLTAKVLSRGRKIELVEFSAKTTQSGISYQIAKAGGRKQMRGGFLARGRSSGDLHVMKRLGHVGTGEPIGTPSAKIYGSGFTFTYPGAWPEEYRYPAHIRYGPSIPEVWGKPLMLADTLKQADKRLATEMERATTKLLADAAKGKI